MRARIVATIAARELRDAMRGRWFLATAGCFCVLSLGLALLGLAGTERSGLAGFDRTTASVANLALVFVPLVTLTLGGLGVAGDLEDGSLALLLAQPLTRLEAYAGKYVGLLAATTAAVCAGFGATGVAIGCTVGGGRATAFLAFVGVSVLLAAATLGLGTLLSTLLGARARVVGAAFVAWLTLVYVSDLGTIGLAVARHLRAGQVFVLAALNPVQQARIAVTLALSDRLDVLGPAGAFGVDAFGAHGLVGVLVGLLVATAVASLVAGYVAFRRMPVT